MPFTPDPPFPKVQGSTVRSKDWNDVVTEVQRLDTAKVNRAGADSLAGPLSVTGSLTLGGGASDLTNTEGDFKIGSAAARLKIGVALSGTTAGDVRVRAHGGTNRLALGGGTNDVLIVNASNVGIGILEPTCKLDVGGEMRIADKTIWFRGDTNHGIGWYGGTRPFANVNVDGPVVFGWSGGGLGTTGGTGPRMALSWNASGNVGVGTTSPLSRLDVAAEGVTRLEGTMRSSVLCVTAPNLGSNVGDEQVLSSFGLRTANNSMLGIRARRIAAGTNWTTVSIGLGMDVDNTRQVNNSGLWLSASGGVGINTDSPSSLLHVRQTGDTGFRLDDPSGGGRYFDIRYEVGNQTVVFYHQSGAGNFMRQDGIWQRNSDVSLKENVTDLTGLLAKVEQLRPVSFDWKGIGQKGLGFIAQEVEPLFPELVGEHTGPQGQPIKGLAYDNFGVLAIGAVKEMKRKYETRIEALEARIEALEARLEALATRT